jgi:hypothetical protein
MMKPEEFAKWARIGDGVLRVDGIEIVTPQKTVFGHGTIRSEGKKFLLKVTLHGSETLPKLHGIYTREQFWKIRGRIEDKLPFTAEGLSNDRDTHRGHFAVEQASFRFDHLSFATKEQRIEDLQVAEFMRSARKGEEEKAPSYWGYCYLEGHEPVWKNDGTDTRIVNDFLGESSESSQDTLMGEFDLFKFALVQEGHDSKVYLRTLPNHSVDDAEFLDVLVAFRTAIAFVNGREAWPQHIRVVRIGTTLVEDICPRRDLAATPYRLLNDTACANGANAIDAIILATRFFHRHDKISKLVERTLHLCLQSSLNVAPLDVGTLSLCAVFEGLVTTLHHLLAAPGQSDDAHAFQSAKEELLELARKREADGAPGFTRLVGLLAAAKSYRPKDALQWLVGHLGLRWEPEMKEAFAAWQSERHALAHGGEPDETSGDRMVHQSRIAGGINLIVARLMGYTGLAIFSAIEDRYTRLADRQTGPES